MAVADLPRHRAGDEPRRRDLHRLLVRHRADSGADGDRVAAAATTTMGAVGIPGQASFITSIAPICLAMGVPIEPLALLIAVETLPDLVRTLGNVSMDVAATATVARGAAFTGKGGRAGTAEEGPNKVLDHWRDAMKYRTLGQGLKVSALGIGCMPMVKAATSPTARKPTTAESIATIHRAIDLGVTFFDTAEVYGPFQNEELLGRAIAGRRDGCHRHQVRLPLDGATASPASTAARKMPAAPAKARCKRLGVDVIDLYYQHRVDPNVPIEETVGGMAELVRGGKVRYIGLSEAAPETLRRAHAVHPIAALQSEYSLWERDLEATSLPVCRELGIGFVPYSPLGRGFLTGQITSRDDLADNDWRRNDPRYRSENFGANLRWSRSSRRSRPPRRRPPEGRARLAARAGRGHRSDPRHQAPRYPRGQCRRGRRN